MEEIKFYLSLNEWVDLNEVSSKEALQAGNMWGANKNNDYHSLNRFNVSVTVSHASPHLMQQSYEFPVLQIRKQIQRVKYLAK